MADFFTNWSLIISTDLLLYLYVKVSVNLQYINSRFPSFFRAYVKHTSFQYCVPFFFFRFQIVHLRWIWGNYTIALEDKHRVNTSKQKNSVIVLLRPLWSHWVSKLTCLHLNFCWVQFWRHYLKFKVWVQILIFPRYFMILKK